LAKDDIVISGVWSYFFFAGDIPGIDQVIRAPELNYYLVPVVVSYIIKEIYAL